MLAEAAAHVVVTAEEIVDRVTEKDAIGGAFIPSILVDAVVHAPHGAHPGGMSGRYALDKEAMREYVSASRDDASFAAYLDKYVFAPRSHDEYVERFVRRAVTA
jgi:glutaconate CoA-transferase subunit A